MEFERMEPHRPLVEPPLELEPLAYLTLTQIATQGLQSVGGKAYNLSILSRQDFPVPQAIVLSQNPNEEELSQIALWWQKLNKPKLAVRSSAVEEDSAELSFAGQQTTFLNVDSYEGLRQAIKACFASIDRQASKAYRDFFSRKLSAPQMNVILQMMVDAKFSGVFFSQDPRGQSPLWVVECIEGLGEDLVSGRKTPARLTPDTAIGKEPSGWTREHLNQVVAMGLRAREILGFEVDMEWAFDQNDHLWCLQARPVTALKSLSNQQKQIQKELNRLRKKHPKNVYWDGQTFSEWTGFPSYLTFSIWKNAFAPQGAFSSALKELGYYGFTKDSFSPKDTLLERVFGRAYVNLSLLEPLFFGPIPYSIDPFPRPHLKFNWRKISLQSILRTPYSIYRMAKVAWSLQTQRQWYLNRCISKLNRYRDDFARPVDPQFYQNWDDKALTQHLQVEAQKFSSEYLKWPFVLIILAEATLQSLQMILNRIYGKKGGEQTLQKWLGFGLSTLTIKMNTEYRQACEDISQQPFFLNRYGHRGPGELDLSNPRFVELGEHTFGKSSQFQPQHRNVEDEIQKLSRFQKPVVLQEWRFLKKMLELREQWKMELMRPYAHLRWMALELGQRSGLGDDVFWLRLSELTQNEKNWPELQQKIKDRKQRFEAFRKLSFPVVVSLDELENIINGKEISNKPALEGEGLSPGMAFGEVRVVQNPENEKTAQWPQDVILVAEATDPGWTPLFQHAKGVIVEKGGVLSHCAIVAREMGIPAVSQIQKCHIRLKNGDHVWVDGTNGRIILA